MTHELRFALGILRRRPFQCLVQVTNRCNMQCSFCDFWPNGVPSREELTLADFQRIAGELAELGCFLVSVEGGEPFVRPDLVDIVRAFAARHLPLLYTNGWYVDEAKARALFDAGLTQVGVSIDFPDARRHDAKRGWPRAFEQARRAIATLRDAAPHGGKQVHVMTVLVQDNQEDLEALLQLSKSLGVGHCFTLLSATGFRRGHRDCLPTRSLSRELGEAWQRHPHMRMFRDYLGRIDAFREGGDMPRCRAGVQSFNIDHVGNVAPCIEKIDRPAGNVRGERLRDIVARMRELPEVAGCQDCWTLCRGFGQVMGQGGGVKAWSDLALRMRSH
ncbi:MAG TPA: radical SAM protein [Burkholderiales bacterium]|nr:radical SAM protein [Burkholderiales bacterium]